MATVEFRLENQRKCFEQGVGQIRFLSVNFEVINNRKVIYSSSVSVKQTQGGIFPDVEHMHSVIPDRKTRAWVILSLKDYIKTIPEHLIE